MSFEDDLKYAHDVMRIRDEMVNETIFDGLPIKSTFSFNFKIKTFLFVGRSVRGARIFGDVSSLQYSLEDANAPSVLTSKSIVYIHDDRDAVMTIGREQEIPIMEYDEALHFQHSLLYSPEQLRMMVTLGVLRANPIRECKRFKIFTDFVPMFVKLLRYKDNGII